LEGRQEREEEAEEAAAADGLPSRLEDVAAVAGEEAA